MAQNDTNGAVQASEPAAPQVESASAGSACQTTNSKFAYVLTGVVLGLTAALAIAITLLCFAVMGAVANQPSAASNGYGDYGNGYGNNSQDYGDGWDDWGDDGDWGMGGNGYGNQGQGQNSPTWSRML